MATNSSVKLRDIAEAALRRSDLAPQLAVAGSSLQPALDIANEVMNAMIRGGPDGQRMNWKWNRQCCVPSPLGPLAGIGGFGTFLTNAFQQDYAVPGLINVDWLEEATYVNINQATQPKQILWADPKRNLSREYISTGTLSWKVCFLPNYYMAQEGGFGVWGQTLQQSLSGVTMPGPGVVYTVPLGAGEAPNNPITQIQDATYGNLYALTTYGTCGTTTPAFPSTVTYPTLTNPTQAATTVTDGTCVWTALNPNGFGFRLHTPPAGNSVVWLFQCVTQMMPQVFTSLNQTLGLLPDSFAHFFRTGFIAKCTEYSSDPKVRAKALGPQGLWAMWQQALRLAVIADCREQEDQVIVPTGPQMQQVGTLWTPSPAYPFQGG